MRYQQPIILFFPSKGGGVQHGQVVLANALAERGAHVICVMPTAIGPFLNRRAPGVRLIDLGSRHPVLATVAFARLLRRVRPRAVIASQFFGIRTAVIARALSALDVPLIGVQHSVLSRVCRQSGPGGRVMMPLVVRLAYPLADRLVSVSEGAAADLAAITGVAKDDVAVIQCTTLTPDIPILASMPTGRPWLDSKTAPVILAVGNLRRVKAYGMLLRAFARLRRQLAARLIILGDGEEMQRLQALAKQLGVEQDVHLAGHEPNPYACMARADVLALSSRHEGFGNVLIEAMACGCPVVSTDCPYGPAEILEHGRYGRLVPVGDDVAMADALMAALTDTSIVWPDLPTRAVEFSVDRMVNRYLDLLGDGTAQVRRAA